MKKLLLAIVASMLLAGCTPRIEIAASKEPITINMNVKIEHEIHIKVDKDVENLQMCIRDSRWTPYCYRHSRTAATLPPVMPQICSFSLQNIHITNKTKPV